MITILPSPGMRRVHGREMGVIECWYTKADKLPERMRRKLTNCIATVTHRKVRHKSMRLSVSWISPQNFLLGGSSFSFMHVNLNYNAVAASKQQLTKTGLILTAFDFHSSWPRLNEEVPHQLFKRISCKGREVEEVSHWWWKLPWHASHQRKRKM